MKADIKIMRTNSEAKFNDIKKLKTDFREMNPDTQ